MKRRVVAAVWIAGATVPLLMATVMLVGCCVLPFHAVMHKLMPLCHMATNLLRGDAADAGDGHETPVTPAREKQETVRSVITLVPATQRLAIAEPASMRIVAPNAATGYRSFISLGAVRCDRDVGLHVLDDTFLI